ncbi:hypothetical protein YC2023_073534 [Brassica napus]
MFIFLSSYIFCFCHILPNDLYLYAKYAFSWPGRIIHVDEPETLCVFGSRVALKLFVEIPEREVDSKWVAFSRSVNALFHSSVGSQEEALPYEWYRNKLSVLTKLTRALKEIDLVDGKLEDINGVIVYDDAIKQKIIFVGSPSLQQKLKQQERGRLLFGTESEREPLVVNSLTKVCNFLDISAQQRKLVRCTVCSQVTQHRIWRGALEDVLNNLKEEVDWLLEHSEEKKTQGVKLGQQVILSCLKFLSESSVSYKAENSTS